MLPETTNTYQVKDTRKGFDGAYIDLYDHQDETLALKFTKEYYESVSYGQVFLVSQENVEASLERPHIDDCPASQGMSECLSSIARGYPSRIRQRDFRTRVVRMDGSLASSVMIHSQKGASQGTRERIKEATTTFDKRFPQELAALGSYIDGQFVLPHPSEIKIPNNKSGPIKTLTVEEASYNLAREDTFLVSLLFGFQKPRDEENLQMYCDCFRGLLEERTDGKASCDPKSFDELYKHVADSNLRKLEGAIEKCIYGATLKDGFGDLALGKVIGLNKLGLRRMIKETISSIYDIFMIRVAFDVSLSLRNVGRNGILPLLSRPNTRDVSLKMSHSLEIQFQEFFSSMDFEEAFNWCAAMLFQLQRCSGFLSNAMELINRRPYSNTMISARKMAKEARHPNYKLVSQEIFLGLMSEAEKLCFSHFTVAFKDVVESFELFTKEKEEIRRQLIENKKRYSVNSENKALRVEGKAAPFVIR